MNHASTLRSPGSSCCVLWVSVFIVLISDVAIETAGGEVTVQPVDCVQSEWSSWSSCDVCQKRRYRYAKLVQPSVFGGEPCLSQGREDESCSPPSRYTCDSVPRCEGFQCAVTGRCVPRSLRCNGDDDCGDRSDERGCVRVNACRVKAEEYWGIESLAKGINILTSDLEGEVLDHRYYAGSCLPHYIEGLPFRKPYNVQQYTMETKGSFDFSLTSFESYSDYMVYVSKERTSQTKVAFDFAATGVFEFGFSYSDYRYSKMVKKIRQASGKKSSFVRAKAELQLARYTLKPGELVLHPEFLRRLRALPQAYVYGEYRQIFRDYGTHYITEAALGGDYEHTVILNKDKLEKSGYSLDDYKNCVQGGLNVGANIKGVYVSAKGKGGSCDGALNEMGDDTAKGSMVEDFVAVVRGGGSESISALAARKLPTPQLMGLWGDSVRYNPEFISSTRRLLYDLVTSRDFVNAGLLKKSLKRALAEYLAETSPCRCAPCHNNGLAVLKGTRCECVCPSGYSGRGCEVTQRQTGIAIDGGWSCWGAWSSCSGGTRTRSRQCNNPVPSNDGMACWGLRDESTAC